MAVTISGAHVVVYSRNPEADRAFLRDVLGFPHVDAGHGWLIFRLPPAEVAVHPTDDVPGQELYLMCDDLDATLRDLAAHGVDHTPVTDARWGRLSGIRLPGGGRVGIYQPAHPRATDL